MLLIKGTLDFRDLDKDSQYYYDKIISDINRYVELNEIKKLMIENLDALIKIVREYAYNEGYKDACYNNFIEGDDN